MMFIRELLVLTLVLALTRAFGGEDKFVKKYAMMKIYESCFGSEVVKQIRKEMKAACLKCSTPEQSHNPSTVQPPVENRPLPSQHHKLEETGVMDSENSIYANAQSYENSNPAILAYRPNSFPAPMLRPLPGGPMFPPQPTPMFISAFQQPNPFAVVPPFALPFLAQRQYYAGQRSARNMDLKSQLEMLASRMQGRGRNVTCVMQELGYLDENLEPNYAKIQERIGSLPIADELRADIQEGVNFCRQFSQCVPEINKDKSPLSRELIRPMFFFKCYKHKKLEACIMKDIREKYTGIDEDFTGEIELRRNGKNLKTSDSDIDELASSMYEFLYGSDSNMDLDTFL